MSVTSSSSVLDSYIQADASARAKLFREFIAHLKALLASHRAEEAAQWARRAISVNLDYASHLSLRKVLSKAPLSGQEPIRVAVLGGPTTTQLSWILQNFLQAQGFSPRVFEGEYGLFRQSILAPNPELDTFAPQVVFLATHAEDVGGEQAPNASAEEIHHGLHREYEQWRHLWQSANSRWGCQIIQNLFDLPRWPVLGHFSRRHQASESNFFLGLNALMTREAPAYVLFHDQPSLVGLAGASAWYDPRYYHEAKLPCSPDCLVMYAHSVAALVGALKGRSRKVVVLDLDNTLWGGVVGDDGVGGLVIGQGSAVGESFVAFQRYLKALTRRGVLLAVCSKNEVSNAMEPFLKIPEMVLKPDDFAAFYANWENKANNLHRIAEDLNLGIDSFVFVDDNPTERALVRQFLPGVAVPDMPEDPAEYIGALAKHRYFEMAELTAEDFKRADFYAVDRQRRQWESQHADVEHFLASLEMVARVEPIHAVNVERSTQLINKSNQFNLTTRRYTLAEIRQKSSSPDWITLTVSLADKFGDNGLISVILAKLEESELVVDTWMMSCRVLQRGVEYAALHELAQMARARGCRRLVGLYIPTSKNGMVAQHYARMGFDKAEQDQAGASRWIKPLLPALDPCTAPIRIIRPDN